jgi:aryl-alcohol dehydrogenase-like predicted oxidoreductase
MFSIDTLALMCYFSSLYGDNEELLGKWFKRTGKRQEIFLATKFGFVEHSKTYATDSSAAYCKEACSNSLERLGIETIDLCWFLTW